MVTFIFWMTLVGNSDSPISVSNKRYIQLGKACNHRLVDLAWIAKAVGWNMNWIG